MPKIVGGLTLFSVDDLHESLGLSKLTIRNYLKEGRIRGRKLGVSWYVTEEALREYFDQPQETAQPKKKKSKKSYTYTVQGINDLVSETEECDTIEQAIEVLKSQAILSLFQVAVIDRETKEVVELVKGRDFLEKHT